MAYSVEREQFNFNLFINSIFLSKKPSVPFLIKFTILKNLMSSLFLNYFSLKYMWNRNRQIWTHLVYNFVGFEDFFLII